jgi:hypothetical protein
MEQQVNSLEAHGWFLLYRVYIFRASRVSNLLWRIISVRQVSCRRPSGRLSGRFLWLAGTSTWRRRDLVLKRSDEYGHAAMNAVSVLKKLSTVLFLVLVGIPPASA